MASPMATLKERGGLGKVTHYLLTFLSSLWITYIFYLTRLLQMGNSTIIITVSLKAYSPLLCGWPTHFHGGFSRIYSKCHGCPKGILGNIRFGFECAEDYFLLIRNVGIWALSISNTTCISRGFLPVRYFGVPLFTKILDIVQCKPLLQRIKTRMTTWASKSLVFCR